MVDLNGGSLGDHSALHRLGAEGRGPGVAAGAGPALAGGGAPAGADGRDRGPLLRGRVEEVPDQLQPIEDEEDPQVVEHHGEAGRVPGGPERGQAGEGTG